MKKNYNLFNLTSLFFLLLSLFLLIGVFQSGAGEVQFEDPALEEAVRIAINKPEGKIEPKDVDLMQTLDATGYGIESLEGIEALGELKNLYLEDNFVKSVAPLGTLTKLEVLDLRNNEITNLDAIDFDQILFLPIRELSLRHNVKRDEVGKETRLSDISLLGQMITLRELDIRDNHIEELAPLGNLRDLKELDLRENRFDNIQGLESLVELEELNLRDNHIESLEPLRYLSRLKYLNIHSVSGIESLEPLSNLVNLETLIMRNVEIMDEGNFLNKLTNIQRLNVIDSNFERIDNDIIEKLLAQDALQGEVRPIRLIETIEKPNISVKSGFYEKSFELEIESESDNQKVYYTLDGSEPTDQSKVYSKPIQIESNDDNSLTVVRAKIVGDNNLKSQTVTKSYFVNENFDERFDLPVFSLVTDPDNFYDEEIGIYTDENATNSGSDWERPVHLEFFEPSGSLTFEQNLGIRIHGGATRSYNQKSLRLYAKSEYDSEEYMNYDFFNGLERMDGKGTVKKFKRLLLRNSGNDNNRTFFNDAFMQSLVEPLGTVDTQGYRPSVVFLNGEYFGLYNIRERFDEYYFETHYDIDTEDLVMLEGKGSLYRGNSSDTYHYSNMLKFIEENSLEEDENFSYIETLIDIENYIDYFSAQIYFGNSDWPHNNIRFWRKRTDSYEREASLGHDGRWRWILFDTDHGYYHSDEPFGVKPYPLNHLHNTIDYVMDEYGGRGNDSEWPNYLFREMMSNEKFRTNFLNRINDLMNSYLSTDYSINRIDTFKKGIEKEIPNNIIKWGAPESISQWNMHIDRKYLFAKERATVLRGFIMEEFNINDTITMNIENESDMGHIRLNTIDINHDLPGNSDENFWSGTYFENVPITLEAIPKDGYEFSHWEGFPSDSQIIEITPTDDLSIRAVFKSK